MRTQLIQCGVYYRRIYIVSGLICMYCTLGSTRLTWWLSIQRQMGSKKFHSRKIYVFHYAASGVGGDYHCSVCVRTCECVSRCQFDFGLPWSHSFLFSLFLPGESRNALNKIRDVYSAAKKHSGKSKACLCQMKAATAAEALTQLPKPASKRQRTRKWSWRTKGIIRSNKSLSRRVDRTGSDRIEEETFFSKREEFFRQCKSQKGKNVLSPPATFFFFFVRRSILSFPFPFSLLARSHKKENSFTLSQSLEKRWNRSFLRRKALAGKTGGRPG